MRKSFRHPSLLSHLRDWSRHAWLLHGWLMVGLILLPFPQGRSEWVDTDSDSILDSWTDPATSATHTLAELGAQGQDIDGTMPTTPRSFNLAYCLINKSHRSGVRVGIVA